MPQCWPRQERLLSSRKLYPRAPKTGSDTFKSTEDMKDVSIDDVDTTKRVRIGVVLSDKQESAVVNFL